MDEVEVAPDPYGEEYWAAMDGGLGCHDSLMWADLAFITHHTFAHLGGTDLCSQMAHVDVGCGMGFMVKHMRHRGFESFGLDYSSYALSQAPEEIKQYLQWFDLAWVDDSHLGRNRFDLLTCFETLEHIPENRSVRALEHIYNLLTPGGVALLNICTEGQPGWDRDPTHVNVAPRSYWQGLFPRWNWIEDGYIEERLQEFHLFAAYGGTFVLRKAR